MQELIPLENSFISDSEPLQRAQSGFSRDACQATSLLSRAKPWLFSFSWQASERAGEVIDSATIPAEAGLDSLKRSTIQAGTFLKGNL